ncbi:ATP-grasp domain-containing protein [Microbacterium sp. LWH3-1.2]|uniref:ATP-grasp domain-containing protein n=1 Tax=Microbacterium sp. LWH3-1.2 TaxID=3135256 RepID=UPI00341291D7
MTSPRVYVIHENPEWFSPLQAAFEAEHVPVEEILLTGGTLDLGSVPAEGVYWSRISASAHTRGHAATKEYARALLRWLESHGRVVVNGSGVLELEVSKVAQHALLRSHQFDVPRTTAVFGRQGLVEESRTLPVPFITKHNQGGKGLGVRRFDSYAEFDAYIAGPDFEEPVDGITLLQEYLPAREPFVTRAEFAGGRFIYAVRVDTSAGSFELCPADACALPASASAGGSGQIGEVCLIDGPADLFSLRRDITAAHPLIRRYEELLSGAGIAVAGIEFIETQDGRTVTYDINTNTNYNPAVESSSAVSGAREVARYLGALLEQHAPRVVTA